MSIGNQLRAKRLSLGMTQEQVAIAAGMNITQYNGYERGRSRPSGTTLDRVAAAMRTTAEKFTAALEPAVAARTPETGSSVQELSEALRNAIARPLGVQAQDVILRIELCLPPGVNSASGAEGGR